MISIEEFKKFDLRIGKILEAQRIETSEKLLKLIVDVGADMPKQIVSGIAESYNPEELTGKEIVILVNLETKTFRGVQSQGMLLAADDGKPIILIPAKEVKPGAKIT